MKIGYVRVSTPEQNTLRQELLLEQLGVERMFIDYVSGKNQNRPQLQKMMDFVREGDTVVVESISRFARNTRDLLELVERLRLKKVGFVSQKEAIDTATPAGQFMLTVFAAVAQMERDYILQRQREGIRLAKEQGKYAGRKPKKAPGLEQAADQWRRGELSAARAAAQLGMSRATFYRRIKELDDRERGERHG